MSNKGNEKQVWYKTPAGAKCPIGHPGCDLNTKGHDLTLHKAARDSSDERRLWEGNKMVDGYFTY
jgi:hypothetical protein